MPQRFCAAKGNATNNEKNTNNNFAFITFLFLNDAAKL